jgi:hypothetical protein
MVCTSAFDPNEPLSSRLFPSEQFTATHTQVSTGVCAAQGRSLPEEQILEERGSAQDEHDQSKQKK